MNAKLNAEELDLLQSDLSPNNNYKELDELELEDYVGGIIKPWDFWKHLEEQQMLWWRLVFDRTPPGWGL